MTSTATTYAPTRGFATRALTLICTSAAALAVAVLALKGHHMPAAHALKAAGGFRDVKPIEGVGNFVDALKGNLSWLFITGLILVIVVVGVAIVACAGGIVA